jgi:hypothetical protein
MIFIKESHLDHGVSAAHLSWILQQYALRESFFIETVNLPSHLSSLSSALVGPIMGDAPVPESDVFYTVRGARKCASRMIKRKPRETRQITVIAGPHGDNPCVLFTAYGGPSAPREPGDLSLSSFEEIVASREFWRDHALASLE